MPAHPKICPICHSEFFLRYGRNKATSCATCYDKYRSLYNLIHAAKHRAKVKNIEFNLDIEWAISQPTVCPKTGFKLTYKDNGKDYRDRSPYAASIDKINPNLGYTKNNCAIVCWWYNVSKQRFTDEEVLKFCTALVENSTKHNVQNVHL